MTPPVSPVTATPVDLAGREVETLSDWLRRTWRPALLLCVVGLLAVPGVFTTSEVFFAKDLAAYYWPHHLWMRQVMSEGSWPLWEPAFGLGYPMGADPALQTCFFPLLPIRLWLPELIGFNLGVAMPFPVAALGLFLWLEGRCGRLGAIAGALVYGIGGPVLSTASCVNLAWSAALLPWLLHGVDRLARGATPGRLACLAALFALEFFAGEPVTLVCAAAVTVLYSLLGCQQEQVVSWRLAGSALLAGVFGVLLAAVQLLPFADVVVQSHRGAGLLVDGWSVHPLSLLETILPDLFGNYFDLPEDFSPWLRALNSDREPYLISLYVGPLAIGLAACGIGLARRSAFARFWTAAGAAALVCAIGYHTPVYPALRAAVPVLQLFRYPSKYMVVVAVALAALAAAGTRRLQLGEGRPTAIWTMSVLGMSTMLAALAAWFAPGGLALLAEYLADSVAIDGTRGAEALLAALRWTAPRSTAVAALALLLISLARQWPHRAGLAVLGLVIALGVDLLTIAPRLNPTASARILEPPPWVALTKPALGRVYIPNSLSTLRGDPDRPEIAVEPGQSIPVLSAKKANTLFLFGPGRGIRDALVIDLTGLKPAEYWQLISLFRQATREDRMRLLSRLGVRYYLTSAPPSETATPLMPIEGLEPVVLYEDPRALPRCWLAPRFHVEPNVVAQLNAMFDAGFDPTQVALLERAPGPPAGAASVSAFDGAWLTREERTRVEIKVEVGQPDGAFLVLADEYDGDWSVTVDGAAADLLRADGLLRAVRIASGAHEVVFEYRPVSFWIGCWISMATAIALFVWSLVARKKRPVPIVDPSPANG